MIHKPAPDPDRVDVPAFYQITRTSPVVNGKRYPWIYRSFLEAECPWCGAFARIDYEAGKLKSAQGCAHHVASGYASRGRKELGFRKGKS